MPLSQTGAELLFEVFSQRYERGSIIVTSNLPFDEWTGVFGSERLTGALLDRLTHHVHILEMNGDSFRLKHSRGQIVEEQPPHRTRMSPPPSSRSTPKFHRRARGKIPLALPLTGAKLTPARSDAFLLRPGDVLLLRR